MRGLHPRPKDRPRSNLVLSVILTTRFSEERSLLTYETLQATWSLPHLVKWSRGPVLYSTVLTPPHLRDTYSAYACTCVPPGLMVLSSGSIVLYPISDDTESNQVKTGYIFRAVEPTDPIHRR